jgi:hypothetical protein
MPMRCATMGAPPFARVVAQLAVLLLGSSTVAAPGDGSVQLLRVSPGELHRCSSAARAVQHRLLVETATVRKTTVRISTPILSICVPRLTGPEDPGDVDVLYLLIGPAVAAAARAEPQ